jgi:cytochrome b561
MMSKSTAIRYGSVAVFIHWISAILILALLVSGIRSAGFETAGEKISVLLVHAPQGTTILLLTLGRIAWWLWADKKPDPVGETPNWQEAAARAVHILFYVLILGMTLSGLSMLLLSGAGPILLGGEGELPDFWDYLPRGPHAVGAWVMMALFVLHVSAALYHHFIKKDGLIARMWFARRPGSSRP